MASMPLSFTPSLPRARQGPHVRRGRDDLAISRSAGPFMSFRTFFTTVLRRIEIQRGAEIICLDFVRVVTRKKATLVFVGPMAGLFSEGCLPPRREAFIIPAHCVKIGVESFTQPCRQRANGKLVCNGVVITANCVAPQSDRHR